MVILQALPPRLDYSLSPYTGNAPVRQSHPNAHFHLQWSTSGQFQNRTGFFDREDNEQYQVRTGIECNDPSEHVGHIRHSFQFSSLLESPPSFVHVAFVLHHRFTLFMAVCLSSHLFGFYPGFTVVLFKLFRCWWEVAMLSPT